MLHYITCSAHELCGLLRRTACYITLHYIKCSAHELCGLLRRTTYYITLHVLLMSCVVYLGVQHIMNMATFPQLLFISVNICKTLYQPFYELATFTF